MASDSERCDECGATMIQRDSGVVLTSMPPQYPWYWWCGCGATKKGGVRRDKTEEQMCREEWERANS